MWNSCLTSNALMKIKLLPHRISAQAKDLGRAFTDDQSHYGVDRFLLCIFFTPFPSPDDQVH